jgi:5-methylcytosine-specific restriction enzyme subunit McrC
MTIPIENIYYLLVYAWDKLEESELADVQPEDSKDLINLFARVLNNGVTHLIRRGIDRNYVSTSEEIAGVRGRIQISESIKRLSFPQARACCEFDEFSYDILHNQIIKSTLHNLYRSDLVENHNRKDLHATYMRLPEISEIQVTDQVFRKVQLHKNNQFYSLLLEICRLISNNLFINERTGESEFRDFLRDPKQLASLFEAFVRNFYRKEQKKFRVTADNLTWQDMHATEEHMNLVPEMRFDICLRDESRYIVMDTKFYENALSEYYGKKGIRSQHLYQLFSYIKNLESKHGSELEIQGALLYPVVNYELDSTYEMHGHVLRVISVDLNKPWNTIHNQLLDLLETFPVAGGCALA